MDQRAPLVWKEKRRKHSPTDLKVRAWLADSNSAVFPARHKVLPAIQGSCLQANLMTYSLRKNMTCTKFEDLRLWMRRTVPKEKENNVYMQLIIICKAFYRQHLIRYSSFHISKESQNCITSCSQKPRGCII